MRNRYRFYAVWGANGAAVMDSYGGVLRMRKYIYKSTCKGFDSFQEAADWAYYMLADRCPYIDLGPIQFCLNKGVFVGQILHQATKDYCSL